MHHFLQIYGNCVRAQNTSPIHTQRQARTLCLDKQNKFAPAGYLSTQTHSFELYTIHILYSKCTYTPHTVHAHCPKNQAETRGSWHFSSLCLILNPNIFGVFSKTINISDVRSILKLRVFENLHVLKTCMGKNK